MKKKKSTKEKIIDSLENKKKVVKINFGQKDADEIDEMAKKLGLDKFSDYKKAKPQKMEYLFG